MSMSQDKIHNVNLVKGLATLGYRDSPGGRRGCGKKKMEFMWMSHFGQFWGADYENRCYTVNFRGLQPRFHENALFSAKNVK